MKKFIWMLTVVVAMFLVASSVFAEETNFEKISGSITFQSNFIKAENSNGIEQVTFALIRYGNLGLYSEYKINGVNDCERLRFWLLGKVSKSVDVLVGTVTDNKGTDFFGARIWYMDSFEKVKVLVDAGYYVGTSNQAKAFSDNLLRLTYSITDRISIGADGAFDYWPDDNHGMILVGPRLSYRFDKAIVTARYSHDWNFLSTGTVETNCGRIEVSFPF